MKKAVKALIAVFIWLCIWEAAARIINKEVLLPTVAQTVAAIFSLCAKAQTWTDIMSSVLRVAAGLTAGTVCGCLLGSVCAFVPVAQALFTPLVSAIRATPVASFIILAFVWIPSTYVPVFTAFLIVTPIFHTNMFSSLKATDRSLIEMARVFHMSTAKRISEIYLPLSAGSFKSALISSVGMSWKASIAAEVICKNRLSIGGNLYTAKTGLETADVFAWTVIVIVLSTVFEKTAVFLLKKIKREDAVNE